MSTRFIENMLRVNGLLDIRHIYNKQSGETLITTGIFNNLDALRTAVSSKNKSGTSLLEYGNMYIGLNRPVLVTGFHNDLRPYRRTVKDNGISRFTHLLFDFDPVRQNENEHCPSTDDEHALTKEATYALLNHLRMQGWPTPLIASSGNGWHLVYRVNLLNEPETSRMLKKLYAGLKAKFSTEFVKFDATVHNASRITRLYSTVNRKGKQSAERPYRKSFCLLPPDWKQVPGDKVLSLCEQVKLPEPVKRTYTSNNSTLIGKGDYRSLDIVGLFQAHGLYRRHDGGNTHHVTCPFNSDHGQRGDTVIFESVNGDYAGFHCKHDSCDGKYLMSLPEVFSDIDAFCTSKYGVQS